MRTQDTQAGSPRGSTSGKFLTVALGGEEYGIPITCVREIVGLPAITRLPNVPCHVAGIMNLRGKIVPAIDLRQKLGMTPIEPTPRTCLVVLQPAGAGLVSLLVDGVCEVLTIAPEDLDTTPGVVSPDRGVSGVAKVKGSVKILLDVATVLHDDLQA